MHKSTNGCRPDQLIGLWSMEPTAFETLEARALTIMASDARYELVARESKVLAEEQRDNPYQLDANGIAHFDISGPLTRYPTSVQSITGGTSTLLLERALDQAGTNPQVRGAQLHIDSPGGHSTVQADVRSAIERFRATGKMIAAHGAGAMCSAAYGMASSCDFITADPAAVVGSVGTMMALSDTSEVFKRAGVEKVYLTGAADRKAAAFPGVKISEQTREELNKFVTSAGASFREQVRERRPQISEEGMKDVLRGGVYAGSDAKAIGLVDDVCDTSTAIERFKQSLSTGSSSRALPVASPTGAVITQRSVAMLTAEQLTQAKSLPDCADISAENADGKLLAAALSQHAIASRVPALETEIGSLKAQVPQPTPPAVLKAMAGASRIHLKDAVAKQAITPAVAESLASALIGEGDNLVAQGLVPTATGECLASSVFSALAGNGPAPRLGEQVAGQPAPKAVAGAPEIKPITEERRKELLAMSGAHSAE